MKFRDCIDTVNLTYFYLFNTNTREKILSSRNYKRKTCLIKL